MHAHRIANRRKCRRMKLLCILSGCPAGARKGRISIFAVLLHSKKQNDPEGSFSVYRKASQSFVPRTARNQFKSVFCRDMCVAKIL